MSRLPTPGGDDGAWGGILNDYLSVALDTDGSLKSTAVPDASPSTRGKIQLAGDLAGTATAPTVPGLVGKIDKSTATTKGDLLVATGASTLSRLGVGAD